MANIPSRPPRSLHGHSAGAFAVGFEGLYQLRQLPVLGGWPLRVDSGESLSGDAIRLGFGLVKEMVAGVRLSSRPG